MSWSKTLRGWALGEEEERGAPQAVAPDLARLLAELRQQAGQLEDHAEQAPNENAERELGQLAKEQRMVADHLAVELGRRGVSVPVNSIPPAEAAGDSHWARLVQDLEHLRAVRSGLLDLWAVVNESQSDLGTVLEEVGRITESHLGRLRNLIARADPQALN